MYLERIKSSVTLQMKSFQPAVNGSKAKYLDKDKY